MTDSIETLLGPRPYNEPPAWPEIPAGDPGVVELLEALQSGSGQSLVLARALGAKEGSAVRDQVLLGVLAKLVEGWKSAFYERSVIAPHQSNPEMNAEYNRWYMPMVRRAGEIEAILVALGRRPPDATMEAIDALRTGGTSDVAFDRLGNFLVGERENNLPEAELAAPRAVLERMVKAFDVRDAGFAYAARAAWALEGVEGLRERVDRALAGARDDGERKAIMSAVGRVGWARLFAADASWVDRAAVLNDDRAGITWPLKQLNRQDLWLRCLRYPMSRFVFGDVTGALKAMDDRGAAAAVREIAAALPEVPAAGDERSRGGLERVARYLERDRSKKLPKPPARQDGLGTDGGPILLLAPSALSAWQGAPKDYGTPSCDPNNDYDRACDASKDGRIAAIDVGGAKAFVLPEQMCMLAKPKSGMWIILRGDNDDIVWNVLGPEAIAFEQVGTLVAGDDGLVLLDATSGGKRPSKGSKKPLKLAAGTYAVEELYLNDDRGSVHIVQLRSLVT